MTVQEIKMVNKTGNMGDGQWDWDFPEGSAQWLSPDDSAVQAVTRGLISPVFPTLGYGCDLRSLRGTKQITTSRMIMLLRLYSLLETLSRWWTRDFTISEATFIPTPSGLGVLVSLSVGQTAITIT